MEYSYRKSALDSKKVYVLDKKSITQGVHEYKFSDVQKVNLRYNPTRVNPDMYECIITTKNQKLVLKNKDYVSFGVFSDNSCRYNQFVLELHEKLSNYPDIDFFAGISRSLYLFYNLIIVLTIYSLYSIVSSMGISSELIIAKFIFFFFLLYLGFRYAVKNFPKRYNSNNIPQNLLPKCHESE